MRAIVYSKPNCPACTSAKATLRIKGYTVEERVIGNGWTKEQLFEDFPDAKTIPQIIVDDIKIGSYAATLEYLSGI